MTSSRTSAHAQLSWTLGPYSLNAHGHLRIGPTAIHLSPLQRRLLLALVRKKGDVLNRETLLQEVWGHSEVSEVSISRTVHGLRRAFMNGPLGASVIRTIYGGGYRLEVPIGSLAADAGDERASRAVTFPSAHTLSTFVEGLVWVRQRDPRRLARAENLLLRCLDSDPSFTPALLQLANVRLAQYFWGLLRVEALEQGLEELLQRVEERGDMVSEVLALRVEVLSLVHWQPALAESRFGSWLPGQLPQGAPLHGWARHLLATGRAGEALPLLEPHLTTENPDGWMLAATAWWFLEEHKKAVNHLREQLRIDPSLVGARLLLALVLADGGETAAALRELEAAMPGHREREGLQAHITMILALCGETTPATTLLQRGLSTGLQAGTMTSLWGLAALVMGDEATASDLLERAVRQRCGLAPFVRHLPGLRRRASGRPVLAQFEASMSNRFRCTF